MGFTHLHVASGYSARYGASHPEHLVRRAAERGMGSLALTDRDNVTGMVRFARACAAHGVRPVFGVDLAVAPADPADPSHSPAAASGRRRTPVRGGAHVVEPALRVTLLARNGAGWGRLCRVVSAAHAAADGGAPVVSWSALREYAGEGLTVLLGPASEPVRALSAGRPDIAERLLTPWRELLGTALRLAAGSGRDGHHGASAQGAAGMAGLPQGSGAARRSAGPQRPWRSAGLAAQPLPPRPRDPRAPGVVSVGRHMAVGVTRPIRP